MNKDIVIITGGTSGLGLCLVKKIIEKGYYVCNIARNKKKLEELNKKYPNNHQGFAGNIIDENFIKETVETISKLGNIKYLINNAQTAIFKEPTLYEKKDISVSLEGLEGMISLTTNILKINNEKDLKIINIMSSAALKGAKNEALYCAVKWGERGYTESLKVAYKNTSVKVIGVYPGGMNTNFWNNSRDYVNEEKAKTFMKAEDVAEVIILNIFNNINLTVSDLMIERNS